MDCKDNEFLIKPTNRMTKYIISLNNIDLNLMPMKIYENNITSYQKYDDEFHSFEIYTEYTGSAFDDIKTSVCYICAVEVPRMFYQEHLSSAKHKMFACLAANTMKRLQLQLLQPMPQMERTVNSVYYCASCSVAVKLCNRNEHELSTQHMNSVKNDELLKQLADMYKESDNDKIDNTVQSVEKNIHDSQHLNCKTDLNATMTDISKSKINTLNCPKLETVPYAKTIALNINKEKNKNCDQQIGNDDKKNTTDNLNKHGENTYHNLGKIDNKVTESKVHTLNKVGNNKNVEDKSVETIKVKNSGGLTRHVAVGETINSKAKIVETIKVKNSGRPTSDVAVGETGNSKVRSVETLIVKNSGVLTSDVAIGETGNTKSKSLETIKVKSSGGLTRDVAVGETGNSKAKSVETIIVNNSGGLTSHVAVGETGNTKAKSMETIKNSGRPTSDVADGETDNVTAKTHYCDICNMDIQYYNRKCIATHKSSNEHKIALDKYIKFLTTYQLIPAGFNKSLSKGHKCTSTSNRSKLWHCLVCGSEVKKPNDHVRESSHILMYNELLSSNLLIKLQCELFMCKFCACFVKRGEELNHISVDSKHLVMKQFPNLTGYVKYSTANGDGHESFNLENSYDYFSSHSSVETLNSPLYSKNEIESKVCTKNTFSDLRPRFLSENDIEEIDKPHIYFCTICNMDIANNEFNIKQHVTGNTHIKKAKLLGTNVSNYLNNTPSSKQTTNQQNTPTIFNDEVVSRNNKTHAQSVKEIIEKPKIKIPRATEYICQICNVKVPNVAFNIKMHNDGKLHKRKLQGD